MSDVSVSSMHDARDEEDRRLLEAGEHAALLRSYFETVIRRCCAVFAERVARRS